MICRKPIFNADFKINDFFIDIEMTVEFEPQPNEIFVPIRGFEHYLISNQGRCWNSKTKKFVGTVRKDGYKQVGLSHNGTQQTFLIHRLMMLHFGSPQPEGKTEIDHIDRDKRNNRIENLRWCDRSENTKNRDKYKQQRNEYLDDLPETAVEVEEYNGFEFDKYYFDYENNRLIMRTSSGKLKFVNVSRGLVRLCDINGVGHTWRWKKFCQEMMDRIEDDSEGAEDVDSDEV